jgi:hypothetical protein
VIAATTPRPPGALISLSLEDQLDRAYRSVREVCAEATERGVSLGCVRDDEERIQPEGCERERAHRLEGQPQHAQAAPA